MAASGAIATWAASGMETNLFMALVTMALFYHLRDLEEGHTLALHRSDRSIAYFKVSSSVLVDKDAFPTEQVYGSTEEPTLRLITCGGDFNSSVSSYEGNLIVYAEHLGNTQPNPEPQPS